MIRKFIELFKLRKINKVHDIDGWLSSNEAIGLYSIAGKLPEDATVVEIGSWQGKSTYCLSKGLKSGKIFAIDPFNADGGSDHESGKQYTDKSKGKDLLQSFITNMKKRNVLDKIVVKKGYSYEFPNDFEKIDFLFIDGDHSIEGCKSDFDLFASKIVPGGFIAFRDYYEQRNELGVNLCYKKFSAHFPNYQFYHQYDSLWVGMKVN